MEKLTKAEEPIMHVIWKLKLAFVRDVIEALPEPKPPYNTVSSVVRILEEKGMIGHKSYGKTHQYFPLIPKVEYRGSLFRNILSDYFDGSYKSLVSQMMSDEKISPKEVNELRQMIDNTLKSK
ncbi:MAG: BlaI family penicillinase repressor [Cyclobacteriaceae bacterium]|jgi:BlaI family penicillinase repressor